MRLPAETHAFASPGRPATARPSKACLWLHALLLAGSLLLSAIAPSLATDNAPSETLVIGDKVTVSVFGQADLSGDFTIDGAGVLHMPLAGRIPIAGLSGPEAELRIRQALTDFVRDAVVSLRVAELRPVYVMGEVRSPGGYPFRHGLKVLGAVALAGGYRVGDQSLSVLRGEFLLADERVRLLEASLQQLSARRTRLEAERDGLETLPAWAVTAVPGASQLLRGEQEIFDFQRRAREGERNLLNQQVARLLSEKTALTEQARLAAQQVELTQEQSTEYAKLAATGHGLRTIQVERERELARTRADVAKIAADLAKNDTALGELKLRLAEADNAFTRRVVIELQETRQKILEVERSVPIAREIYESRRRRLVSGDASGTPAEWDLRITRQAGLESVTILAQVETALQPGDIVQIMPKAQAPDLGGAEAVTGAPSRVADQR